MPILLILMLTGVTARVNWPAPLLGPSLGKALLSTILVTLLPVVATATVTGWAARVLRAQPYRRAEVGAVYSRWRRRLGYAQLFALFITVFACGWGWAVWRVAVIPTAEGDILAPLAELLVPAPFLLALMATWMLHYRAERALHQADTDRWFPTDAAIPPQRPFWSPLGYFGATARPFTLLVLMPVVLFACHQTFIRWFPETASELGIQIGMILAVPVVFVLMPLVIKPVLGLQTLPAGPKRARMEYLSRQLGFRYRDLLLWPTRGGVANALVVGVVPWARYVIVTDRLLDELEPDELDAVFGHEVGHVRHGHIPYYLLFIGLSAITTSAVVAVVVRMAAQAGWIEPDSLDDWLTLPPLMVMGGYIFVVFGFLSRKCERQADVFGAWAAGLMRSQSDPDVATPTERSSHLVQGIDCMVRALTRVANVNGMDMEVHPFRGRIRAFIRSWQHGPIPERIQFLQELQKNPALERGFQRRVLALRCGLILALLGVVAGICWWLTWEELLMYL